MSDIRSKMQIAMFVSAAAITLLACGGGDKSADTGNTATTEMLSTETTLDGTTNDATSLDAAAGSNNEVAAPANEVAADNSVAP